MRKSHYGLVLLLLVLLVFLTQCGNRGYSKKQAQAIMTEYIQKKYGSAPTFEWVRWHKKKGYSQGYYAKTTDGYYIRMNVFTEGNKSKKYDCLDTKEYGEIAEAMKLAFADNPLSDNYLVEINPINDASKGELWDSLKWAFHEKWNDDLQDFLLKHEERFRTVFQYESWESKPNFYVTIRPDSVVDYSKNYEVFDEYVTRLRSENEYMFLSVLVVPPSLPVEALGTLNTEYIIDNPRILLDNLRKGGGHDFSRPVVLPSQGNGAECYIYQGDREEATVDESYALTAADPPGEPISYLFGEAYRIISPVYSVENIQDATVVLDFDLSVVLKDYLTENPDAQFGKDFVLLELESDMSWITPVVPSYDSKNFDTPENAEKYLENTNKYTYTYGASGTPKQICFGVLEKE